MSKKRVFLGDEARRRFLIGAKILYDAVSVTLGPKGQNALIGNSYSKPIATHDGVTVAKSLEIEEDDDNLGASIGIQVMRETSTKTNDIAGDGTTTATVLAYHLLKKGNELINNGKSPMVLRNELNLAAEEAVGILKELAVPVTKEKLIEIATISSESPELGKVVAEVFNKLGKDATVSIDVIQTDGIDYEATEGYKLERGFFSPYMINDTKKQQTKLNKPSVVVVSNKVGLPEFNPLLENVYESGGDSVLLVAEDITPELLSFIIMLKNSGKMEVLVVKTPGYGQSRIDYLEDIAALTGTKVIEDAAKLKELEEFGHCSQVVATATETVLVGGQEIKKYLDGLTHKHREADSDFDKQQIEERISALQGKVAVIKVGGKTEIETEDRRFLVEDAVAATRAALKEGIVPGGATTMVHISKRLSEATDGHKLLKDSLTQPFIRLMRNAGERAKLRLSELDKFGEGFDVANPDKPVNLMERGIVDPSLVTKEAIQNAVSIAKTALTMGCMVVEVPEKDKK